MGTPGLYPKRLWSLPRTTVVRWLSPGRFWSLRRLRQLLRLLLLLLGPRPLLTLCGTSSLLGALVAPVHRQTFVAQRVQIAPDAALVPTTLVTMCAEDLSEGKNRRRVKFWRC